MDFSFSEEEERFRAELREFISVELPAWWRGMFVDDARVFPETRRFCAKLAERGWLTMAWPREHGGEEASAWKQAILREEMWANDEPRGPQYMNLNYIGPCIMRFGSVEQKRRFLPPMAEGRVLWTQGFSEPNAGSDLAALTTRAEPRAGSFIVNGQKIWNSYADAPAEWCFLLARTGPSQPKHRGLSVLLVDMRTPGITVRPVGSMAGPHELNEIFFDDVVVPDDCLLGGLDRGWEVVTTGLTFERVGIARYARAGRILELLVEHVRRTGQNADPRVRDLLADLRIRCEAARLLNYRAVSIQASSARAAGPLSAHAAGLVGEVPTVEASLARLHNTHVEQLAGHVGLEILGPEGQLTDDAEEAPLAGIAYRQWVRNIPTTITAGTTEVQKNIVARRGLGLPKAT